VGTIEPGVYGFYSSLLEVNIRGDACATLVAAMLTGIDAVLSGRGNLRLRWDATHGEVGRVLDRAAR
jgi:hypothetical protein